MSQNLETLGKYILLEKIQTGGMAEIFLARKPGASGVSKFVAIKRILPQFVEQADFIEMFKDEAKIAVNLTHANIVSIHEFGMEKNNFFIAMDFVEGRNLRQILNKMKKSGVSFSIEQVLFVIKEVAAGLDHAHRCIDANTGKPLNIIHRDMSPQNVMVSFEGEVKIVDFGIAKAETQIDSTRAGTLKGKFSYMSPEQAEGQVVDLRTDIFALAIVLWELLANDRLFVANNEMNTLRKVRDCQIPSLRKINPNIPPELERITSKALAKDRNLRYQTAAAFHRELSRFLNRQYPDFSQHDFSVFIKTLFAAEILENRKKMVDYAKVELPSDRYEIPKYEPPPASDMTSTENTVTPDLPDEMDDSVPDLGEPSMPKPEVQRQQQSQQQNQPPKRPAAPAPPPRRPVGDGAGYSAGSPGTPINTSSLSVDRSVYREPESSIRDRSFSGSGSDYFDSRSSVRRQPISSRLSGSLMPMALILVGVAVGASVLFPNVYKEVQYQVAKLIDGTGIVAQEPRGETTNASRAEEATYLLKIESVPSGAEIRIDGVPAADVTPATIKVKRDIEAHIEIIKKPGYASFEHKEKMDGNKFLSVTLQKERVGRLDINVVGAGRIFIDGQLVANGSPANDVPVPADREVVVCAEDPVTKASDQIRVRVGENMTKKITLIPRRSNQN